jgi:hypothetical protein
MKTLKVEAPGQNRCMTLSTERGALQTCAYGGRRYS